MTSEIVGGEPAGDPVPGKGLGLKRVLAGSFFIGSKSGRLYIVNGRLNAPNFEVGRRDLWVALFPRAGSIIASNAVCRIFARKEGRCELGSQGFQGRR